MKRMSIKDAPRHCVWCGGRMDRVQLGRWVASVNFHAKHGRERGGPFCSRECSAKHLSFGHQVAEGRPARMRGDG